MRRWMCVVALCGACGGKEGDSGSAVVAPPYMNILSPTPGEYVDEGAEVRLLAEGRLGSHAEAPIADVIWFTADGAFETSGNDVLVNSLHPGVLDLVAEGVVDGVSVTESIEVVVYAQ